MARIEIKLTQDDHGQGYKLYDVFYCGAKIGYFCAYGDKISQYQFRIWRPVKAKALFGSVNAIFKANYLTIT